MLNKNSAKLGWAVVAFVLALSYMAVAQNKTAPAKSEVTGRYEGSAKNSEGEVIPVTLELTEKEGAISGMIRSSHGDFAISNGSHKEDAVSLEFDAEGTTGTISLKIISGDQLTGTWSAGSDGGSLDVKKGAPGEGDAKGKS